METQKKIKQSWSIKLGLVQAAVLLGVVTGSMLCAFYLGLISGQKAGFESAQAINLASVAKLPIPEQYRSEELDSVASKVYAKLSPPAEEDKVTDEERGELPPLPELSAIQTAKVVKPVPNESDEEVTGQAVELAADEADDESNIITILSKPPPIKDNSKAQRDRPKTLGELKESAPAKEVAASTSTQPITAGPSVLESLKNAPLVPLEESPKPPVTEEVKVLARQSEDLPRSVGTQGRVAPPKAPAVEIKAKDVPPPPKVEPLKVDPPPPPKERTFVKSSVARGWYAQVAATSKVEDANGMASKLKASGFPVVIEEANIRGEKYYRVLVGPEEERRYSETMVQQLKRESYLRADPFIKLIK